jgi:hypothetical protein
MAMNTGKVIVGGLVAGLVFNIGDFVINGFILAEEQTALLQRLGLEVPAPTNVAAMLPWVVIDFLFGILVVWTYAAIRPRFGPGVSTAIIAGLIPYLGATLVLAGFTSMGMFTTSLFIKGSVASLVNTAIGSVAGAWVYTES